MKIVVIGGSGLIGSKVVNKLREAGHEAVAASPASGVNTLTGEGLDAAMAGTQVVLDVANSPSFEDKAVLEFFQTSGRNLLAAEAKAGVKHHVALSVVGTDRLSESGYFRAKVAQEALIREAGIPYTIVHSTQFFEFLGSIAQSGADGDTVHLSPAFVQPIASGDVAAPGGGVHAGRAAERRGRDRGPRARAPVGPGGALPEGHRRRAHRGARRACALLRRRAEGRHAGAGAEPAHRRAGLRSLVRAAEGAALMC
jgi:uncharacterized protein YbjT (DUF2867 family)